MSQIKLLHSGGNGVILAAPSSNPASDRTLTLPSDADGTVLSSASTLDATKLSGNLPALNGSALTGVGGGITVWDTWILTSSISNYEGAITSNLARPSAVSGISWGTIGTGMTESSGVFTFPQTGMWDVVAHFLFSSSTAQQYSSGSIQVSSDSGSNFSDFQEGSNAAPSNGTYGVSINALLDVTNISTTRVRFFVGVTANWTSGHSIDGTSGYGLTKFEFRRIADT